jgi:hypothetical protein
MRGISQNGWPLLGPATTGELPRLRKIVAPGTDRHFLVRDGSAGFLLVHFALWWDARISRLRGGVWDEWGYSPRTVRGSTTIMSNHASGTAVDLDATQFPRGIPIALRFKPAQVALIRRRLRLYGGALDWGGDFRRTPDGMHVEISPDANLAAVERVARRLLDTPRGKAILKANPGLRGVILS